MNDFQMHEEGIKEAEIFIRKHMPLIIKDKNGNPQYPFKSVNAYEQVCKQLSHELVKSNSESNHIPDTRKMGIIKNK